MKMQSIELMVRKALIEAPETRNSDPLLYLHICKSIRPDYGKLTAEDAITNRALYGLPKFISVERARRKLQADYVELRAVKKVTERRYDNYKEVLEYVQE